MNRGMVLDISLRMVLRELDFTIAEMEKAVSITLNGFEMPDSYQTFCQLKIPSLYKHNYILLGMDKAEFLKQCDLHLRIISNPTTGHIEVRWLSVSNTGIDDQFFDKAFRPIASEAGKSGVNSSDVLLNLEAAIMHYSLKPKKESGNG